MNFVRSFSLPKPVPGCTYAVFRLAVLRSRAGQLDYNTTRASLCQHLFSIFSTNFSPPFWALCILLSATRRTTRGGFLRAGGGGLRPHGVFIARNVPGCGNAPRAAYRPPLHPMVNRTIRRERRACRNVPAAGSRPRPTNPRKIRTTRKTTIIRQSGEIHNNFKPKPQTTNCIFVIIWESLGPAGQTCKGFTCGLAAEGLYW